MPVRFLRFIYVSLFSTESIYPQRQRLPSPLFPSSSLMNALAVGQFTYSLLSQAATAEGGCAAGAGWGREQVAISNGSEPEAFWTTPRSQKFPVLIHC